MSKNNIVTTSTPPNLISQPDVQMRDSDFDVLVYSKGYEVIHEKAISCPCYSKAGGSPLSDCQNCRGTGWVLFNPNNTKMVLQSMNLQTRYREWSKENLGTVIVTSRSVDQLAFMDRITVKDSDSIYSQILFPVTRNSEFFAFTIYDIKDIYEVFMFEASNKALKKISSSDYSYERNKFILDSSYASISNLTVSIRYKHWTEYHVIDIVKETRRSYVSTVETKGKQQSTMFPFNAVARRSHYVLDALNQSGSGVIDNSYVR